MDYLKTVISQYGNSPTLLSMIKTMSDSIDCSQDIEKILSYIWDVDTAQGFGLDILGVIVGIGRVLNVQPAGTYLGFNEGQSFAGQDYNTFDHGVFYNGPEDGSYVLSDQAYRTLIKVKALSNISDGTPYSYNRLLSLLFDQKVYCRETAPMHMEYVFSEPLEPYQVAILSSPNIIPRPAGVAVTIA
jgi:hypothetical protein